jgi:hypothetical protein
VEELSAYKLAQRRIEQRQRGKTHTVTWLLLAVVCILLTLVAGGCAFPLTVIAILFAVYSGIEWYFASKKWTPPQPQIEQEMEWLFGEDWQSATGVHEFSLALERIYKRRKIRGQFAFHLGFFGLAHVFIIGLIGYNLNEFYTPGPIFVLPVPIIWLGVLVLHFVYAFPNQKMLMQRERQAGEAIQQELDRLWPSKLKNEDKLKRDVYYMLGDDGELVEVDQNILDAND